MSEAGLRDLFVELPLALFESLQAIGEAAVSKAMPMERRSVPVNPWLTEHAGRRLAERYGVRSLTMRRRAAELTVDAVMHLGCGHTAFADLDELVLHLGTAASVLDAIDAAVDRAERECCCMQRPPSWSRE